MDSISLPVIMGTTKDRMLSVAELLLDEEDIEETRVCESELAQSRIERRNHACGLDPYTEGWHPEDDYDVSMLLALESRSLLYEAREKLSKLADMIGKVIALCDWLEARPGSIDDEEKEQWTLASALFGYIGKHVENELTELLN